MSRCAILVPAQTSHNTDSAPPYLRAQGMAHNLLSQLGYDVDLLAIDDTNASSDLENETGDIYEFFVFPILDVNYGGSFNGSWRAIGTRDAAKIPTFICSHYHSVSPLFGCDSRTNSSANVKHTHISGADIYGIFNYFAVQDAPSVTVYATQTADTSRVVMWKYQAANAPYYVASAENDGRTPSLQFLLQHAINDGEISAPPNKRQVMIDADDLGSNNTLTEIQDLTTFLKAQNVQITAGIHGNSPTSYAAGVFDEIKNNQVPNGPYVVIDHQVSGDPYFFDWDLTDGGGAISAETAQSRHESVLDYLYSQGIVNRGYNNGGYRYFNENKLSVSGVDVLSEYGVNFARVNQDGTVVDRVRSPGNYPGISEMNGIKFVSYRGLGGNVATEVTGSAADIAGRSQAYKNIFNYANGEKYASLYFHNFDLYDGHDGGTGNGFDDIKNNIKLLTWCNGVYELLPNTIGNHWVN